MSAARNSTPTPPMDRSRAKILTKYSAGRKARRLGGTHEMGGNVRSGSEAAQHGRPPGRTSGADLGTTPGAGPRQARRACAAAAVVRRLAGRGERRAGWRSTGARSAGPRKSWRLGSSWCRSRGPFERRCRCRAGPTGTPAPAARAAPTARDAAPPGGRWQNQQGKKKQRSPREIEMHRACRRRCLDEMACKYTRRGPSRGFQLSQRCRAVFYASSSSPNDTMITSIVIFGSIRSQMKTIQACNRANVIQTGHQLLSGQPVAQYGSLIPPQ